MTNEEAIKMFKAIIMEEIGRLPHHYDAEVDDDVYDDINKVDEILQLNKIISKALKKADKYKWHDLRENPDDLPEANRWGESNYVLVKALIKVECFACNDMRKAYYSHTQKKWSIDGHVFAWRYIEPFKDEECVFWMNDNIK